VLKKQRLFNRYPDLPNRPDQAFSFNPGNSENPDTKEAFPCLVPACPDWESGFINAFPEMEFLGYYQMSLRDKVPDVVLT
jgi:hypothetical protein